MEKSEKAKLGPDVFLRPDAPRQLRSRHRRDCDDLADASDSGSDRSFEAISPREKAVSFSGLPAPKKGAPPNRRASGPAVMTSAISTSERANSRGNVAAGMLKSNDEAALHAKVSVLTSRHRIIEINDPELNASQAFVSNFIKTSKYTPITFLPKNLFEQFRRVANLYFLCIVAIQTIPNVSPFPVWTSALPLTFMMGLSAIKEAWEDYKRYREDVEANSGEHLVYNEMSTVVDTRLSRDIKVGDLIKLRRDELIPADCIVLYSPKSDGSCYISTASLDGEVVPKVRNAAAMGSIQILSDSNCGSIRGTVYSPQPNKSLVGFEGTITLITDEDNDGHETNEDIVIVPPQSELVTNDSCTSAPSEVRIDFNNEELGSACNADAIEDDVDADSKRLSAFSRQHFPLGDEHFVFRGSKLINTDFVWAVVIATGVETKVMLNLRSSKFKFATYERVLNTCVFILFATELVVCFTMTIGNAASWNWPGLNSENGSFLLDMMTYIILFSFFIPLSLYVTVEFVKLGQARLMESDSAFNVRMKKKSKPKKRPLHRTMTRTTSSEYRLEEVETELLHSEDVIKGMKVNNSSLSDELGLVDFIFTDKTGTLTQNRMELSEVSASGVIARNTLTQQSSKGHHHSVAGSSRSTLIGMIHFCFGDDTSCQQRVFGCSSLKDQSHDRTASMSPSPETFHPSKCGTLPRLKKMRKKYIRSATAPHVEDMVNQLEGSELDDDESRRISREFVLNLLTCNAVVIVVPGSNQTNHVPCPEQHFEYSSESPDELAFVYALRSNGIVMYERSLDIIKARVDWSLIQHHSSGECAHPTISFEFRILALLKFSSSRRRMSVVVEDVASGEVRLFTKGADSAIFPCCCKPDSPASSRRSFATELHLRKAAERGSRTLVLAGRLLDRTIVNEWLSDYERASTALDQRDSEIERAFGTLERDLELLGCTAVDDQMQHGVPETIDSLLDAGIGIFMLTGDKQETAVTIGRSSHIIPPKTVLVYINVSTRRACKNRLRKLVQRLQESELTESKQIQSPLSGVVRPLNLGDITTRRSIALVIDGYSLELCITVDRESFKKLLQVSTTIICNRATPAQKAMAVKLVKVDMRKVCLAIGDGANDVSAIIESNVGVGILGQEGSQAALAADFVIHRFRHLKNLLFVHGRLSMLRTGKVVFFSFYKNTAFVMPIFWYAFHSGFTGTPLYYNAIMSLFNMFFTSLPPLLIGLLEEDVSPAVLLKTPLAFKAFRESRYFSVKTFFMWKALALSHSIILFYLAYGIFNDNDVLHSNGRESGMLHMGALVALACIVVVNSSFAQHTSNWVWPMVCSTIVGPLLFLAALAFIAEAEVSSFGRMAGVFSRLASTPSTYLYLGLSVGLCIMGSGAAQIYTRLCRVDSTHRLCQLKADDCLDEFTPTGTRLSHVTGQLSPSSPMGTKGPPHTKRRTLPVEYIPTSNLSRRRADDDDDDDRPKVV